MQQCSGRQQVNAALKPSFQTEQYSAAACTQTHPHENVDSAKALIAILVKNECTKHLDHRFREFNSGSVCLEGIR